MLATVRVLVYAAEQIYGAGKGSVKLEYVCDELEARGLKVDLSAIEAAVREMNFAENWEMAELVEPEEQDGSDE